MLDKKLLRQEVKRIKRTFPENERLSRSGLIFLNLEQRPYFIQANVVLLYWSMNDEVYTHAFAEKWQHKKNILLPSVNGNYLDLKQFRGKNNMVSGQQFGILEPNSPVFTDINNIDLIIVPGVAFDEQNNRMGRGRGYYDRLLNLSQAIKIGVCFDFQFFKQIPVEPHDIPMDAVIYA